MGRGGAQPVDIEGAGLEILDDEVGDGREGEHVRVAGTAHDRPLRRIEELEQLERRVSRLLRRAIGHPRAARSQCCGPRASAPRPSQRTPASHLASTWGVRGFAPTASAAPVFLPSATRSRAAGTIDRGLCRLGD